MVESTLRFTLFTEEHIVDFVNNTFGMTLDKQNMVKPDRALMLDVLPNFVKTFGIDISQIDFEACQGTFSVNNMENFIQMSNLVRVVQGILSFTNFDDFNVSDVIFPKRKRNQKIFSQLIALMLNYLELDQTWRDQFEDKLEHLPAQRMNAMENRNLLREQIEEKSIELNRLKQRNQPLHSEYKELKIQIKELEAEQPKLIEERARMKAISDEISNKISELVLQIDNLKSSIELQRMKIVSSPSKLFANSQAKEMELKLTYATLKNVKRERIENQNLLAELDKQLDNLKDFDQLRQEIGAMVDLHFETTAKIGDFLQERKVLIDQIELLELSLHNLEKNKSVIEKDQQQLENSHKMDMRPFLMHNNRLKSALDNRQMELNTCKSAKVNFQPLDEKRSRQKEMVESFERFCAKNKRDAVQKVTVLLTTIKV